MHSLLLAVSFITFCLAQNTAFPQNIELDLIFPRNNTVYAPTAQFPVVIAIQNAAAGWPYGLAIEWDITSDTPVGDKYTWSELIFNSSTEAAPSLEPFLFIGNSNKTTVFDNFELSWSFSIYNASTGPLILNPVVYPMGDHSILSTGNTVYFSIRQGGIPAEVVVDGKCPDGVEMFVVESTSTADSGTYPVVNPTEFTIFDINNDSYPGAQLLYTPPEFNPCAVKVDKVLSSSISAVLASQTPAPTFQ